VVVPRDPCVCNMHDVHSGIPRFFLGVLPVIELARIIGDTETGEHTLWHSVQPPNFAPLPPQKKKSGQENPNSVGGRKPMLWIQATLCVGPHTRTLKRISQDRRRTTFYIIYGGYNKAFMQELPWASQKTSIQAPLMQSIFKILLQGPFRKDVNRISTRSSHKDLVQD
jgi:hypothetical protein